MKRFIGIFLTLVLLAGFAFPLIASAAESEARQPLTFHIMSDIHYYDPSELQPGEGGQIDLRYSAEILHAAVSEFLAQDESDILLVSGDVTHNGNMVQHEGFIREMRRITEAGKRVYVITATHDYGREVSRNDLPSMYNAEFGYQLAYSTFDDFSYAVELAPGYRLLCLNSDQSYSDVMMEWILARIAEAKAAGDVILAMTHRPFLPPADFYPVISERDMLRDYDNVSTILADAGLKFMFSGHSHMHGIKQKTTVQGNTITDITTGALCGYPAPYRKIEFSGDTLRVSTLKVQGIESDLNGLTLQEHL